MGGYKGLILLAAAGVLGFSEQAAGQTCAVTGSNPSCTGRFGVGPEGAVFLKVTAKDVGVINSLSQNISVALCDDILFDAIGHIALVARTASPKDVFRCTVIGKSCIAQPVQKSPTAASDSVLVTFTPMAAFTGPPLTGRFTIRGNGWDEMKVQVLDTHNATVTFPTGLISTCP